MTDVERRATPGACDTPERSPDTPRSHRRPSDLEPWQLGVLISLCYLPFIGLGYGTDIDITNIRRSGASILAGDYRYSRAPGAFPHEALTGILDRVGGPALVNLGSVMAAGVALAALGHLVERRHGGRAGRIAVVVAGTQPWLLVAATSLGDYLYALALLLVGIDAAQRDRRILAGLAFGLAVGFRSATWFLVVAYLLAELTGSPSDERGSTGSRWSGPIRSGATAAVAAIVCFVPPWLSVGRTAEFLENQLVAGDVVVMAARWGVKNVAFLGLTTLVILIVRAPVLWASIARFRDLVLVRFAVFAAIATQLVFLRFPWKPIHLLPFTVCLAILLAVGPRTSNRLVAAVVASQLLLALVSVSIAAPDIADAATDGRFAPGITPGVVINDVRCRLDPPFEGTWPALDGIEADLAAVRVFECQARSWRAGEGPG